MPAASEPIFEAMQQNLSPAGPAPIPQPGSAEALVPLQPLIDALHSGDSIIIFPEGTRGHTGNPQNSSRASTRWRRCSRRRGGRAVLLHHAFPLRAGAGRLPAGLRGRLHGPPGDEALKRDRGIPNWGRRGVGITGANDLLDRVDALCFAAAPVFFHSVRWYFGA